jgi:K+-transporting ATPase ATPase C chain
VATYPARPVPADAVTSSASGLDPDISPENARTQLARVAKARGVAAETVNAVVNRMIKPPALGFIGAPRVNVLQLNMALDELPGTKTASR